MGIQPHSFFLWLTHSPNIPSFIPLFNSLISSPLSHSFTYLLLVFGSQYAIILLILFSLTRIPFSCLNSTHIYVQRAYYQSKLLSWFKSQKNTITHQYICQTNFGLVWPPHKITKIGHNYVEQHPWGWVDSVKQWALYLECQDGNAGNFWPCYVNACSNQIRLQEHTIIFITKLLSPENHLISQAPFLNVLLVGISSAVCVHIFSLHGSKQTVTHKITKFWSWWQQFGISYVWHNNVNYWV